MGVVEGLTILIYVLIAIALVIVLAILIGFIVAEIGAVCTYVKETIEYNVIKWKKKRKEKRDGKQKRHKNK